MPTATHDIARAYLADHLSIRDKAELANFAVRHSELLRGIVSQSTITKKEVLAKINSSNV
jgi:hypothetical protein